MERKGKGRVLLFAAYEYVFKFAFCGTYLLSKLYNCTGIMIAISVIAVYFPRFS